MERDTIAHGETYTISAAASDADGVAIAFDNTWSAACRICSGGIGGETAADIALTIADGVATGGIDTETHLSVGKFSVDVRFTDESGNDYWSEPWSLNVLPRNTPAS